MPYDPTNNPYIPGDPYSYDLKWMVDQIQAWQDPLDSADRAEASAQTAEADRQQAEAWAVGTIDSDPVTADDPQYENNSKYWADEASESAAGAASSEAAAADYAAHIADPVSGIVTTWLTDHITNPSSPPVDTSLSVGGAAADAAVTGDHIRMIEGDEYTFIEYNWNLLAVSSYLNGWKTGYYDNSGVYHASSYFICTNENMYADFKGATYVEFIPPSGYAIAAVAYEADQTTHDYGNANSSTHPENINVPVMFETKDYEKCSVSVGRITDGTASSKVQDHDYISTIKMRLYYPKDDVLSDRVDIQYNSIITLSNQENGVGLFDQGGYSRSGSIIDSNSSFYPYIIISDYLHEDILSASITGSRSITVIAFDSSDIFQGFLGDSYTFTTNDKCAVYWHKNINIAKLRQLYPGWKLKIEVEMDATIAGSDTAISVTDGEYVTLYIPTQNNIREYYIDEMADTIKKVRDELTEPALVFPIITDIHYRSVNSIFDYAAANLKKFSEAVKCDFILNLGDNTDGNTAQDVTLGRNAHILTAFNSINAPYYQAIGNHDTNYYQGAPIFNSDQIWQSYYSNTREVQYDMTPGEHNYYKDFPELGIRLIVLDANFNHQYKFSANTASWLTSTALNTPYIVILAVHLSPIATQNWNGQVIGQGPQVEAALSAFVNNGGTLIQLCGHSHADYYFQSPWLTIYNGCQKFIQEDTSTGGYLDIVGASSSIVSPARTADTASEDLWTVAIVKPISRTLKMIRFGAGSDRSFNF